MKLISRKALVAVAATTALTFSGLTAPAFADTGDKPGFSLSSTQDDDPAPGTGSSLGEKEDAPEGDPKTSTGSSDEDGKTDWSEIDTIISVLASIVGLAATVYSFVQALNK